MKILILGINGFIGSSLTKRILRQTTWQIRGIDVKQNNLDDVIDNSNLIFKKGCINEEKEWVLQQLKAVDLVIPLAAIATPMSYVKAPISVFQSVFETNMWIVKACAELKCRLIFPSTSEVYGMCDDELFDESNSSLVLGPIHKERWIYSCSKQLLDRVIWAYGKEGLPFTLFRPFNWIGHGQDSIYSVQRGSARLIPQFLGNILRNEPLLLVDGGMQRRSFTDIRDGIDALMQIIRNEDGKANGKVFNIGNPKNNASIVDVAHMLIDEFEMNPDYQYLVRDVQVERISKESYYGRGYQDVQQRTPNIDNIYESLKWKPRVPLAQSIKDIVDYTLKHLDSKAIENASRRVS